MRIVKVKLSEEDIQNVEKLVANRPHYPAWFRAATIRRFFKELLEDSPKSSLEQESNSK